MRFHGLLRAFFIIYCMEAGFFLLLGPWSPGWDRVVFLLHGPLRAALLHPLLRGAVSGFGLVHLVWSTHDLTQSLGHRFTADSGGA